MLRLFPSLTLLVALAQCASRASARAPSSEPHKAPLTQEHAAWRAQQVSHVAYELALKIGATDPDFSGDVHVRFALVQPVDGLTIDFAAGQVDALTVNGQIIAAPAYNRSTLTLPRASLHAGHNELTVRFRHPYSQTGSGLYRFQDPEDHKTYLYTDFEPFEAHELFPCFDQPDLKATYQVKVEAPADWSVISSTLESSVVQQGAHATWNFPQTPAFSTYIFALHAGPYRVWRGQAGQTPLRLFARQSLAKYVQADEWLKITRQGLEFYPRYFGYPYPFAKYDQVIVPDFNAGAMENVAAVTFSEDAVVRGGPTAEQREDAANTILHEMAHMWFGDLVTMHWWNDLWLNESFATYMADLALSEATEYKQSWVSFFANLKHWAYWEDGLVTTHAIEGPVADTDQAKSVFDGISYGKGASVLKQLAYFVGEDKFRAGVQAYFKQHAFGNARREDFVRALAEASGQNLDAWSELWLRQAGTNKMEAHYTCANGRIASFELHQSAPPEHDSLRPHRTVVGLIAESRGQLVVRKSLPLAYAQAITPVPELRGEPCPLMVYPNVGDQDFAKVRLDPTTLAVTRTRIGALQDPLLRMMFWESLWNMVEDAELPVGEFIDIVQRHLGTERNFKLATKVLEKLHEKVPAYLPRATPTDAAARAETLRKLEDFYLANLRRARPGSDFQKLWFDGYAQLAQSPAALANLAAGLRPGGQVGGFTLDQDRRWTALTQLASFDHPEAEALRVAEQKRDPSAEGHQSAIAVEAARPAAAVKDAWFTKLTAPDSGGLTAAEAKSALGALFPEHQEAARARFAEAYFEQLARMDGVKDNEFVEPFARNLIPALCNTASEQRLQAFLDTHPRLTPVVRRELRIGIQMDERCVRIRARAAGLSG
jgi:aminopeptidase N